MEDERWKMNEDGQLEPGHRGVKSVLSVGVLVVAAGMAGVGRDADGYRRVDRGAGQRYRVLFRVSLRESVSHTPVDEAALLLCQAAVWRCGYMPEIYLRVHAVWHLYFYTRVLFRG